MYLAALKIEEAGSLEKKAGKYSPVRKITMPIHKMDGYQKKLDLAVSVYSMVNMKVTKNSQSDRIVEYKGRTVKRHNVKKAA